MKKKFAIRLLSVARDIRQFYSFFIGRYTELPFIRFVAISILIGGLLSLTVASWTSEGGVNTFGSWIGGDYVCFYVAGTILNEHSSSQLYDFHLQSKLLHAFLPRIPATAKLPFINPPFFALLFRPFAMLPFTLSFIVWVLVSIILYVWGFLLVRKTCSALPSDASAIAFLLAISFEPFLMESAIGGNSSAFGFFFIALALYLDRRGFFTSSGMALGPCLYKPTFLLLIIPMLIFARRIKLLLGFITTGVVLAAVSCLAVGMQPCLDYLSMAIGASHMSVSALDVFRTFKYVDILSFFQLLSGGFSPITWAGAIASALVSVPFLIRQWWRFDWLDIRRKDLVWACTLTLTTVLNLHFGIYDSIIVVLAILLTANALYQLSNHAGPALTPLFRSLIILLYVTPWFTQQMSKIIGLQIFTAVLAVNGVYQLYLAQHGDVNAK